MYACKLFQSVYVYAIFMMVGLKKRVRRAEVLTAGETRIFRPTFVLLIAVMMWKFRLCVPNDSFEFNFEEERVRPEGTRSGFVSLAGKLDWFWNPGLYVMFCGFVNEIELLGLLLSCFGLKIAENWGLTGVLRCCRKTARFAGFWVQPRIPADPTRFLATRIETRWPESMTRFWSFKPKS